MPRPRKPTNILKLNGAMKRNPGRYKGRENEPEPDGVIGNAPDFLSATEQAVWRELVDMAPPDVLTNADRHVLEEACRLMATLRAGTATATERGQWIKLMSLMGFSPVDRTRLGVPNKEKENPFAEF